MYARNRKSGIAIAGTLERLSGVAHINADSFKRGEDGKLAFEHSGWTEVHWNGQRTATDEHDRTLFVDDDGGEVTVEDIELTETDPRGEGAAFATARKTGREILGDERAIELWGSLEGVPSCPVSACRGPAGDGDAPHLDLTTNADAYALCEGCRTALRERGRTRAASVQCVIASQGAGARGRTVPTPDGAIRRGRRREETREGSASGLRGLRRADGVSDDTQGDCGACEPNPATTGFQIVIGRCKGGSWGYRAAYLVDYTDQEGMVERLTGEEQSGRTVAEVDARAREALAANPRRWFVNEYLTWREYGGPEEGGWHFDAGSFIGCRGVCVDGAAAVERLAALGDS